MHGTTRKVAALATVALAVASLAGCGDSGHSPAHTKKDTSTTKAGKTPTGRLELGEVDGYSDFTIQVNSVTLKPTCTGPNLPPRNGRYVQVHLTVTAKKASDAARSPLLTGNWSVRDAAGHKQPADFSRTMICLPEPDQFPTTLDTHGRASGSMFFDIPKDATKLVDTITFVHPSRKLVLPLKGVHTEQPTTQS